ncbi:MAG TPA: glycosyl hydrolase [Candidatus Paceibacterota bacterium]|nr:glycosyl hydrolase [Candidatus Paceibacterota bacterium]
MKTSLSLLLASSLLAGVCGAKADWLDAGFANPPASTQPWCYWYWISDNISREGITRDLEAMKRVGIGQAFIGNIYLEDVKIGDVKALTDEWWGMVEHAVKEGGRLGVEVGLFNCPGWSQSGGPWIKPEQAMRYVAFSELRVTGPARFEQKLPAPGEHFQDIAVLAFPAPREEGTVIASKAPRLTCSPALDQAGRLVDGDRSTEVMFPAGAGRQQGGVTVELELAEPFTARSLVLVPVRTDFSARCELQAADAGGAFRKVRDFVVDRSNNNISVGFIPHAPVAISFPKQTSTRFRLVFSALRGQPGLAEIELRSGPRIERYLEKQLAKMHPTPLPMWDAYLWPQTAPLEADDLAVAPGAVQDLTRRLQPDGTLRWDVPPGDWIVVRSGMLPTGIKNAPASPEGQGLEVDKMNATAVQAHFDAYIGRLLKNLSRDDRKAFTRVIADSYEMGSQNWTDGLAAKFKKQYGYDPLPYLPALTGRVVGGADQSDRFLWDLRRLVADEISYGYVGGLRKACNRQGLKLWLENYGHWGFPGEFLQYGGQSDEVSGEFWATGDLGSIELRAASSAAHIYGKPRVSAEAFTSVQKFESTPWSLKKRGDWALTEGINHWVLHVYIHQPWEDRLPGVNAWFSTEFNRHNTWFEQGREWINYYRRCHFLLQQGKHVADIAYFIGEDTPKMTGVRQPPLPPGYDFDYLNAEVILERLKVRNHRFVLPDGMSYRLLVLPQLDTMRPELLRKIRDLVADGGAILGAPPARSPSLQNHPQCDQRVRELAAELWAGCDGVSSREARFGKGRVFRYSELPPALAALGIPPDFSGADPKQILWTHRSTGEAEIYFVSNQSEQAVTLAPVFRVKDKAPELWDAVLARRRVTAVFDRTETGTCVPLQLEPRGSVFVVFREPPGRNPPIVAVRMDDQIILQATPPPPSLEAAAAGPETPGTFTMTGWVKPAMEIGLPPEADSGVQLRQVRNELVTAFHGDSRFPEGGCAGAGISVGRNGVVVYEHTANYYAPLLTYAGPVEDWTHLAVVYDAGQPSLYLNGKLVRKGLRSRFKVHSGLSVEPSGNAGFRGEFSGLTNLPRALAPAEITALATAKPAMTEGWAVTPIQISRQRTGLEIEVFSPSRYTLEWKNGRKNTIHAADLPPSQDLGGPWQVHFPSNRDVPPRITLARLVSLAEHPDPAIQHFAGTARYTCGFEVPADRLREGRRLWLDLGRVESVAEVFVNGRPQGIYWKPPYHVDITSAARAGTNALEVRVTGTWRNRLLGDVKYPNGFPRPGAASPAPLEFKPFLTADLKLRASEPLAPSGLLGPVRLHSSRRSLLPY